MTPKADPQSPLIINTKFASCIGQGESLIAANPELAGWRQAGRPHQVCAVIIIRHGGYSLYKGVIKKRVADA